MRDNLWKLWIFIYLSLWFVGSSAGLLWLISGDMASGWNGDDWAGIRVYVIYALAGCMGGTLYAVRAFHQFYDQPLQKRFIYWYLMRPYMCGGTAMVLIILLDSGILLLQAGDSIPARIGLSFLAGFGYGKFMEKLTHLTEALFNGNGDKRSGGAPGTPGAADNRDNVKK
ncbi:hypothetical protein [Gorillibacterium sp. sgz5001074]|uniref:hypothetical protein n=1 Tax=Gorillibacterium sp. sgz5001074 TaxID=3446695 RepID=UPI003F66CC9C